MEVNTFLSHAQCSQQIYDKWFADFYVYICVCLPVSVFVFQLHFLNQRNQRNQRNQKDLGRQNMATRWNEHSFKQTCVSIVYNYTFSEKVLWWRCVDKLFIDCRESAGCEILHSVFNCIPVFLSPLFLQYTT